MKLFLTGCLGYFLLVCAIALLLTLGSLFHRGEDLIHNSFWFPDAPTFDSDYRVVPSWGYPLGVLIDHPTLGTQKSLDRADSINSGYIILNFIFWWFIAIVPAGVICGVLAWRRRGA
jgi:hypothetical protein